MHILETIYGALEEFRDYIPQGEQPDSLECSPASWDTLYVQLEYLAKKAEKYRLEALPQLLEAKCPIGMIDQVIKRLESDDANFFAAHEVLTDMDRQLAGRDDECSKTLRELLKKWKVTHFNRYGILDAIMSLTLL